MKDLVFTPKAEGRLVEIFAWTLERFGPRQAEAYVEDLVQRCDALAQGTVPSHGCGGLIGRALTADLRYARAGQHFIVFQETASRVRVVDFIHSRMDFPGKMAGSGKGGAE